MDSYRDTLRKAVAFHLLAVSKQPADPVVIEDMCDLITELRLGQVNIYAQIANLVDEDGNHPVIGDIVMAFGLDIFLPVQGSI